MMDDSLVCHRECDIRMGIHPVLTKVELEGCGIDTALETFTSVEDSDLTPFFDKGTVDVVNVAGITPTGTGLSVETGMEEHGSTAVHDEANRTVKESENAG
jgi:hypothetical protein